MVNGYMVIYAVYMYEKIDMVICYVLCRYKLMRL